MSDLNVAVVGFFGSGSSAITDLLKEYNECYVALNVDERGVERPYEHKLFYTRGGIFETTILLTNLCTAYCSDIFVNSFRNNMKKMYENNFVSFGSYKKLIGVPFWDSVEQYCKDIGVVNLKSGISRTEHKVSVRFSPIMAVLQIGAKLVFHKPIYKLGKLNKMDKNPYYFTMPSKNTCKQAAKDFINRYFALCRNEEKGIYIFDQLIHAQHTELVDELFDDNFRAIIIRRDPRDLYCLSKYVWSKPPHGFSAPLPVDIDEFCDFWKKTTTYNDANTDKVLNLCFEDLVYKYDDTIKRIEKFLNLSEKQHISKFDYFDPTQSIKNTQIFERSEEMKKEAALIAERLPELIYDFPYKSEFSMDEIFEDTNETRERRNKK